MEESNKLIIKNTLYLYLRQFIIMILSFFTTRIVLEKLGVSDYGVNNIVAGFVSMFTMLNGVLQTGTRRFLSLNLGKGDKKLLNDTFSTAFVVHTIMAITVILLLESIGLWFLNNKLNIETNRMVAANWVFQFSVINVFLNITQTPFVAAITSHEHFNIYAFMSIYDTIAKILVLFILVYLPGDKLIIYSALQLIVSCISIIIYRTYCIKKFEECKLSLHVNKPLLLQMSKFSGWSAIGNILIVGNSQGLSILLNIFFNTAVNAARGLANTVTFTITQFVNGFIIAGEPQLVKSYGAGDKEKFISLIFNITQYTLFLIAIIAVPVFMEIDFVLKIWLNEVPEYTSQFIKITILSSLLMNSYIMLDKAITASGHIKQLALIANTIPIIQLPLIYLALKLGYSPIMAYWITLIPQLLGMFSDLWIIKKYEKFPSERFFMNIIVKNLILIGMACIIPYYIQHLMEPGLIRFLIVCTISVVCTLCIMWFFALNKEVRKMVINKFFSKFHKKSN
ncbi:lipopolysaccharide biosynthesis protein [Bacteroides mediterraneensis]|uniref:Lipopolysaccharide biosynthesis protein n=1 Tax=Bacteroides mediterraneensis TaxID=1841856 RepID=A0ABS2EWX3_9BACE|nr:hypothetical protein [Bacteroides mediterraneensis]MBM6759043.1 hypothetical protein [Bacteroides mediterraneensis]